MSPQVTRYHPMLIALHWVLALAIVLAIGFGGWVLDGMANDNPAKSGLLRLHVILGLLILVFTVLRLVVRVRTPKPAPLVSGKPLMDKVAVGIHHLLYTLTVLVAVAGLGLAYSAHLLGPLFQHIGSLPKDFDDFAAHTAHGLLAYGLLGVVAVHVAGALQHQFILKDGILSRMSLRGEK